MYERYFVGQFFVVMSRRFARFVCGAFVRVGMDSFYCMVQYAPCDFFVDKPQINNLDGLDFYFIRYIFLLFFGVFLGEEGEKLTHSMC